MKHSAMLQPVYLKYKVTDITGQIGAADTFIDIETNEQDCVWAPCAFASIIVELILLVLLYNVLPFLGILNVY